MKAFSFCAHEGGAGEGFEELGVGFYGEDAVEGELVACYARFEEFFVRGGCGFFVVGADFLADVAAVEAAGFGDYFC